MVPLKLVQVMDKNPQNTCECLNFKQIAEGKYSKVDGVPPGMCSPKPLWIKPRTGKSQNSSVWPSSSSSSFGEEGEVDGEKTQPNQLVVEVGYIMIFVRPAFHFDI